MTGAGRGDLWFAAALAALAVTAGTVVGAATSGGSGAIAGTLLGGLVAVALWRSVTAPLARRQRVRGAPFPAEWRAVLEERCDHYHRLPPDLRRRFESDVAVFLSEKRITGIEVEARLELRLLVAASAATLTAGWEGETWDHLAEVLLYRRNFGRDYSFEASDLAGQAHPWGTVILSVPALEHSFDDPDDGFHVGLHEFAHLLDVEETRFDGVPRGLGGARAREWRDLVEREMDRLRRGKSVLDPYAGESPAEFLAVAVETFFERPIDLRERHGEVYAILRDYFGQDPAAWDEARGLD